MDDFRYLYERIKQGEGQRLDFKRHITSAARIARTLVAFANSDGGILLVGIDDQGQIKGIDLEQEKHVLIRAARSFCDPPLFLEFRHLQSRRLTVLEVEVKKSRQIHRAVDENGRRLCWLRAEDQTVLGPGEAEQLLADQRPDPIPILMEEHMGLLNYLQDNTQISVKDYMQLMHLPYHTASRSLESLVESGVLVRDEINGRAWYALEKTPG